MIREANELDILALGHIADVYVKEDKEHLALAYNRQKMMTSFINAMLSPDHNIFVAEVEGKIVGFMWSLVTSLPWSHELLGLDNIFYVLPEYRGKAGVGLIKAHESWCFSRGAKQVAISVASGIHPERTAVLFSRLGYHAVGFQYRKEIQNV